MGHPEINALSDKMDTRKKAEVESINEWDIASIRIDNDFVLYAEFQVGLVGDDGPNGCGVENVIDVAVKRLQMFQGGEFPSKETEYAILALQEALFLLAKRGEIREAQGVANQHLPHTSEVS